MRRWVRIDGFLVGFVLGVVWERMRVCQRGSWEDKVKESERR